VIATIRYIEIGQVVVDVLKEGSQRRVVVMLGRGRSVAVTNPVMDQGVRNPEYIGVVGSSVRRARACKPRNNAVSSSKYRRKSF